MSSKLRLQKMSLEIAQVAEDATSSYSATEYTVWEPSTQTAEPFSVARRFSLSYSYESPNLDRYWESVLAHSHEPPNLDRYWESVFENAKEFGYSEPKDEVFDCAKMLFSDVLSKYRGMFDIYPTEGGEIVLDAYVRGEEYYSSVLLICRPDGQVLCSVVIGDDIRGNLSSSDVRVNSFIEQAFFDLQKELAQWHVRTINFASGPFAYHT